LKHIWKIWKSYWSAASVLLIQCGVLLVTVWSISEWFLQINPWTPGLNCAATRSPGNLSKWLMIGQTAGEKFAKIIPIKNVYWSYFGINRVKTKIVNLKSLEHLKFFLNHRRFLSWPRPIKPYFKSTLNVPWDCPFKHCT
jgi:hypothetical protein